MLSASKPSWQQVTALVSLSASGTVTGFSFVPHSPADLMSPTSMPVRLMALERSARPAASGDAALRSAIVNVASYYLRMAQDKTPAEMEAIIWQHDSLNGVDHGESCAAFASLTLELASQVVGQQSWVTGGTSYPWPLEKWADVRVDPNPSSPDITSVLQDAETHGRWHPLGDGYQPQPGDWVLFDNHVEVVTKYTGGTLYTIGGDSLPNFSVNAHEYPAPLSADGVAGFVNNGDLPAASAVSAPQHRSSAPAPAAPVHMSRAEPTIPGTPPAASAAGASDDAAIPGTAAPARSNAAAVRHAATAAGSTHADHDSKPAAKAVVDAAVPGIGTVSEPATTARATTAGAAAIPGVSRRQATASTSYGRHLPPRDTAPVRDTTAQQAFIDGIAPGAIATQQKYGIPAAVTIAQAIDESGWGRSLLATQDNNLFGIKGDGPAGSDSQPTQEYENGQWVTISAAFRVYNNVAQSIDDHAQLLATSGYYTRAMADRSNPNEFANALTGVYATNPSYGGDLIQIMQQYDLYRYDASATGAGSGAPAQGAGGGAPAQAARGSEPVKPTHASDPAGGTAKPAQAAPQPSVPGLVPTTPASPTPGPTRSASPSPDPKPTGTTDPTPTPTASAPTPTPTALPQASHAAQAHASQTPEPLVSPTYDAGWIAGSGLIMGAGLRELRRRSKRRQQGDAPEVDDQLVSTTISSTLSAFVSRPVPPQRHGPAVLGPAVPDPDRPPVRRYQQRLPASVKNDFVAMARGPLLHGELLYRDIASSFGLSWELLAACDWMQCHARPRYSPVHGERLGARNHDGSVYWSRSEALEQCARDLVDLADAVYGIDLTTELELSVADLARVFAAFRWGGLLRRHRTSAMEFPYSVAGLTVQHMNMRWPSIGDPNTPDRQGTRFRKPFGAVPIVLSLHYPATV